MKTHCVSRLQVEGIAARKRYTTLRTGKIASRLLQLNVSYQYICFWDVTPTRECILLERVKMHCKRVFTILTRKTLKRPQLQETVKNYSLIL